MSETLYTVHFWLFSALAVLSALAFVTRRNPVAAALWLINVMFALAALYVMLGAHFLGAIQVLVYAGAIMVVFIFVVMLLNLGRDEVEVERRSVITAIGSLVVGVALAGQLLWTISRAPLPAALPAPAVDSHAVVPVATSIFTEHLIAFEVTSILLLVAVVGAVVLAKPRTPAAGGAA
jgi:NADH-quinone oxidoreductase subunit J